MPTRDINLTEHLDRFVDESVSAGRYQNASEVVRGALRLLEKRNEEFTLRLDRLRTAVQQGEAALARSDYHDIEAERLSDFLASLD